MHPQLELLLEIQDLRSQRAALQEAPVREVESGVFDVQIDEALSLLEHKLEELADRLDSGVRSRYRQFVSRDIRAVVPVLQGICYGCFVAVPTAVASEATRNQKLAVCENCGRFLYHVS
ncbi:MAG: C4-type zinc ribbon domain-containing protein [Gemmatimonadota bacterium]